MSVGIRWAEPADAEALAPLYEAFFAEDGVATDAAAIRRNLATMLADPRARIVVAEDDRGLAAFAAAALSFGVEFGWSAEIEDLFVTPSRRGMGLARRLTETLLDWARARGAGEVFLVITPEAEAAQSLTAFYRRLGFEDTGRLTMRRSG